MKGETDKTLDDLFLLAIDKYPKEADQLRTIHDSIKDISIGDDTISTLLTSIRERSWATDLAIASIAVGEGRGSIEDISRIYERYDNLQEELTPTEFVTDDLDILYENTIAEPGLRWRLNTLNRSLGSLRRGDFGFIFARPETGKTTFLASEVTFFANQAQSPGLWFNNEQEGSQVALRCYQGALGATLTELLSNRGRSKQDYYNVTKGNLKIYDSAQIHRKEVEKLCEAYQPSFLVFDQIDKIKGFSEDREDLRLGSIYIWARELAKSYCPIIGVCQAGASAEGKRFLEMDDIVNSKTSKAAEADWILGIGASHDDGMEYVRHLHIIKNKLLGDEDTDPTQRHSKHDVIIDTERARYKDI